MKKIKYFICLLLMVIGVVGCNNNNNSSPVNDEGDYYNVYKTPADEFHVNTWIPAPDEAFELTDLENGDLNIRYNKSNANNYCFIYTTMKGDLADFSYVNITIRGSLNGTAIRNATLRIARSTDDLENNIIGADYNLALSPEFTTFTLKIKSTFRTRLDLATVLAIYPDIGKGGIDVQGNLVADEMEIRDVWFSKELPAGVSEISNPNVDSGEDDGTTVNGWKTYSWCGYSMVGTGSETTIGVSATSIDSIEWAFIEYPFSDYTDKNKLTFKFKNLNNTIDKITFKLRGDEEKYINSGDIVDGKVVEYGYALYYEQIILQYENINQDYKPDANGIITLEFDISSQMQYFKESPKEGKASRMEDNLSLVLLVESDPTTVKYDQFGIADVDGYGQMTILETYLEKDDSLIAYGTDGWFSEPWTGYTVKGTANGVQISYTNAASYGRMMKKMDYNGEETLEFVINKTASNCDHLVIKVVGDEKGMNTSNPNNPYMEYYEYTVGIYDFTEEVTEDNITLILSLTDAMNFLKGHMENGLTIWLLVESDDNYKNQFDSAGDLFILSCEFK